MYRMTDLQSAVLTGGFMKEKQRLAARVTVPYIRRALYDEIPGIRKSGAALNFKIAAGDAAAEFYGLVSQDSDFYKWMEAAFLALLTEDNEQDREALCRARELLERAQQKDGYLNTYYIANGLKDKWSYLRESCQLYCAGHLIEAAVSGYEAAGEEGLLNTARRYADCIDRAFGPEEGKLHGYDGHAEIELALYRLYEMTGEERYRRLAGYFIEERGKKPCFFASEKQREGIRGNLVYALTETDFRHSQSHLPIREQTEAVGHAVKAMYFYTAAADKARLENDEELLGVLRELFWDVTERKMFLTGAIGSSEYGESFTYPYDLPGDLMYGETCASIGLFIWAYHMLLAENERRYADTMERALYNGILCGISENGTEFFYTNALECDPEKWERRRDYSHLMTERQSWFECPCCPSNLARLVLSVNRYLYTASEDILNVHLYMESRASLHGWRVEQKTEYPEKGEVRLRVSADSAEERTLTLRLPGWCRDYEMTIDGKPVTAPLIKGYLVLRENWSAGHEIMLYFSMPVRRVYADTRVKSLQGKAAVMKGPVVYCAEEADNGPVYGLFLREGGEGREVREENSFAGMQTWIEAPGFRIEGEAEELYMENRPVYREQAIRFLPYRLWNNRGRGEMRVFLPERK